MPKHDFGVFLRCCLEIPKDVIILKQSEEDGRLIFRLPTKKRIIEFIGNAGLEQVSFVNTEEWRNNFDKSYPLYVDAYEFRTLNKLGYIAIIRNERQGKWIVKSFHLSKNDPSQEIVGLLGTKQIGSI